jgi:D-arabinose 1-dehydrogenase-like Zn-dependent alcohol dehydrogenase
MMVPREGHPTMPFRRQSLTAYAAPLCETIADPPEPRGAEVLVRVARCGVCHSDVHLQDGYFSMGQDKRLDITAGRKLPFTLGHEIAGVIARAGPDAGDVAEGRAVAVYPWIGCGTCPACARGDEILCNAPRQLGITVDGGFATHVLVPHPRYLLDYAPIPTALAAAYMLAKGGKVVVAGLLGGAFATPVPTFPLKVITIEGTFVGTLAEAHEMLALARAGKVPPVPISERPLSAAQASLDDLRNGRIVGRVVLAP